MMISGCLRIWIWFDKWIFITCQIKPSTMCYLFSNINSFLTFTTVQPMDLEEEIAKFRFYIFWYMFVGLKLIASGEIGGTFPGTAWLIILLNYCMYYQRMTPSWTALKIYLSLIGIIFLRSWSSLSTSLTWCVKANFSASLTLWIAPYI